MLEVIFYYLQIFNASVFLFYIQIRGSLGHKNNEHNKLRYKHDAIEYYELDIDWFSFQFVLFFTHFNAFIGRSFVLQHGMDIEQQILIVLMVQRMVQFFLVRQLRDQKKIIQEFSEAYWLILLCIQIISFVLFFQKKSIDIINSMFWIDTIVLIFQYLFYRVTYQAQKDQIELENEQQKVEKQLEDDIK